MPDQRIKAVRLFTNDLRSTVKCLKKPILRQLKSFLSADDRHVLNSKIGDFWREIWEITVIEREFVLKVDCGYGVSIAYILKTASALVFDLK